MRKSYIVTILTAFFIAVSWAFCKDLQWDDINAVNLLSYKDTVVEVQLCQNISDNFPKYVTVFNSAKVLKIRDCNYTSAPDCISNMTDLEEVMVNRCYNLDINDLLYKLRNNSKIKNLILTADSLNKIPDNMKYMANLNSIDIRNNNINVVPATLLNIKFLDLSDNHIIGVEAGSKSATSVEFLTLDNNNLTKMPVGMEHITTLKCLYLNDNPDLLLEEILNIIPMLPNLHYMEIRNIKKDKNTPLPKNITNLQGRKFVMGIRFSQFSNEDIEMIKSLGVKLGGN